MCPEARLAVTRDRRVVLLAVARQGLGELRSTLRERFRRSPLNKAEHVTRELEKLYRDMWREWCVSGDHRAIALALPQALTREMERDER